eukprot:Awhi_evm1s1653
MLNLCRQYNLIKVSFPMQCALLHNSQSQARRLLEGSEFKEYTITAWGEADSTIKNWLQNTSGSEFTDVFTNRIFIDTYDSRWTYSLAVKALRL